MTLSMLTFVFLCTSMLFSQARGQFQSPFNGQFQVTNGPPTCDVSRCSCCPIGTIGSREISSTQTSASLQISLRFVASQCLGTPSLTVVATVPSSSPRSFNFVYAGQTGRVDLTADNATLTFTNTDFTYCTFSARRTNGAVSTKPLLPAILLLGLAMKIVSTYALDL